MDCYATGTHKTQDVAPAVSGKIGMLCEIEALQHFQKFSGRFTVAVFIVKIEVIQEKNGW